MTIQSGVSHATQLYDGGEKIASENLCRRILGLIALNSDRAKEAVNLISRAIKIQSDAPSAHTNLVNAYMNAWLYENSLASLKRPHELSSNELGRTPTWVLPTRE